MLISDDLRKDAVEAFHDYERVFIDRIVKKPGWRLDASPLHAVLLSGDEQIVKDFIGDLRQGTASLLNASIAW
jgi:hypothetical protein